MNCNSFEESIALYVEGDLDASQAKSVESHLKACTSCQRFLNELEASQAMVKELAAESLDPVSFNVVRERVMQEVNRRQAVRPGWWQFLSPMVAQWQPAWAAALAVLVGLGFFMQWQAWRKPTGSDKVDSSATISTPVVRKESPDSPPPSPSEPQQPLGEPGIRQFAKRHMSPVPHDLLSPTEGQPDAVAAEAEPPVEQGSNLEPEESVPADIAPEPLPALVIRLITDDPNIVIVWLVDHDAHTN